MLFFRLAAQNMMADLVRKDPYLQKIYEDRLPRVLSSSNLRFFTSDNTPILVGEGASGTVLYGTYTDSGTDTLVAIKIFTEEGKHPICLYNQSGL